MESLVFLANCKLTEGIPGQYFYCNSCRILCKKVFCKNYSICHEQYFFFLEHDYVRYWELLIYILVLLFLFTMYSDMKDMWRKEINGFFPCTQPAFFKGSKKGVVNLSLKTKSSNSIIYSVLRMMINPDLFLLTKKIVPFLRERGSTEKWKIKSNDTTFI